MATACCTFLFIVLQENGQTPGPRHVQCSECMGTVLPMLRLLLLLLLLLLLIRVRGL